MVDLKKGGKWNSVNGHSNFDLANIVRTTPANPVPSFKPSKPYITNKISVANDPAINAVTRCMQNPISPIPAPSPIISFPRRYCSLEAKRVPIITDTPPPAAM